MLDALPLGVGKVAAAAVVEQVGGASLWFVRKRVPQPRQAMPQLVGD